MEKYNIDDDFKIVSFDVPFHSFFLVLSRIPQKILWGITMIPKDVHLKSCKFNSLKVKIMEPINSSNEVLPCLLYFHGGSFAYSLAPHQKVLTSYYAKFARCRVILLDYSLLPRNKYPTQQKETLEFYRYVLEHSEELKIDKTKIAIGGDSAGAYLAYDLVDRIYQMNLDKPIMQMLIYPVIFMKKKTKSMKKYTDTPRWDSKKNDKMKAMFYKDTSIEEIESNYLENRKLNYKLDTYIEVTEFDCLHDEGEVLYTTLKEKGVPVEFNSTKGTIHGYDLNLRSDKTKRNVSLRIAFLKRGFNDKNRNIK